MLKGWSTHASRVSFSQIIQPYTRLSVTSGPLSPSAGVSGWGMYLGSVNLIVIIAVVAVALVLLLIICVIVLLWCRRKRTKDKCEWLNVLLMSECVLRRSTGS